MQNSYLSVVSVASRGVDEIMEVAAGLCPVPVLPLHIMRFHSNMFVGPSLFDSGRLIQLNQWSPTSRARFGQLKMKVLPDVECSAIETTQRK